MSVSPIEKGTRAVAHRLFVWLSSQRGSFEPQLWERDFSQEKHGGGGTSHRGDMPNIVGERLARKYWLKDDEAEITLEEAMARYPAPT